ncbi:MAG: adenylyl-sulfate kinase [Nitrospirae bacterium RBG_13_39_12]|nr:MAG: adenylyl-sulfate kinase [Nitrospirae bacterium RBG_13_39_12]
MENHVVWHNGHINRQDRNRLNNHKSGLVWFTGLPSSGKSTIAHLMEKELFSRSIRSYVLDGDNVRHGLNSNLGFSRDDRKENLRRIVELSKLMVDAGLIVLAAFISPYREDRKYVRGRFDEDNFLEVYVKCPVEECERRDPKGNYKRARAGIIREYTGISAPYEEPENPDLIIDTEKLTLESSIRMVLELLDKKNFVSLFRKELV